MAPVKFRVAFVFKLYTFLVFQWSFAKHVHYTFKPKYFCGSPDGVRVCHILGVNGQFPGPTIRATINDTLHITVYNHIQPGFGATTTSIHWHGILQRGSPFQDGVDSLTQCPIPALNSQTYVFKVEQSGTYWYHSHVGAQYSEGLWGPIIIDNKPEAYADEYDDEILITLSDWYHTSGARNTEWYLSAASHAELPIPFSNLLNGRGRYPCNATRLPCSNHQPEEVIKVTRGKRYRIRIINTSTSSLFYFYIPNHKLTLIEVDGVDTAKISVNKMLYITSGQRYSLIAEMNAVGNEHWIVAESEFDVFHLDKTNINPNPNAVLRSVRAKLVYGNGNPGAEKLPYPPSVPKDAAITLGLGTWVSTLLPLDGIFAPRVFDQEIVLTVGIFRQGEGGNHLTFNGITFNRTSPQPLLGLVMQNKRIPTDANPFFTKYNQVVQIVVNNQDPNTHPFHLHGHTFWIVGKGKNYDGDYNSTRDKLTLSAVRRDTESMAKESWMVVRFISDNPGVWQFHCHFNWHLQSGLAATIIEAPEVARRVLRIPSETKRVCKSVGVNL